VKGKENKSIETGNRDDAFVFWREDENALIPIYREAGSCLQLPLFPPKA